MPLGNARISAGTAPIKRGWRIEGGEGWLFAPSRMSFRIYSRNVEGVWAFVNKKKIYGVEGEEDK